MPEWFGSQSNGPAVSPLIVGVRLVLALAMGALVAWIYVRTTRTTVIGESFPATLALLAVLIAMVTQVIGDNVARAFSLVGALSIVRFRTVVRDTKDTAYVIFAVVVGMAVGAQNLWVAGIGLVVIGAAAFVMARQSRLPGDSEIIYLLTVRVGLGEEIDKVAGGALNAHLLGKQLMSVGTAKQGTSLEYIYEMRLKPGCTPERLIKALNLTESVQDVRLQRRSFEQG